MSSSTCLLQRKGIPAEACTPGRARDCGGAPTSGLTGDAAGLTPCCGGPASQGRDRKLLGTQASFRRRGSAAPRTGAALPSDHQRLAVSLSAAATGDTETDVHPLLLCVSTDDERHTPWFGRQVSSREYQPRGVGIRTGHAQIPGGWATSPVDRQTVPLIRWHNEVERLTRLDDEASLGEEGVPVGAGGGGDREGRLGCPRDRKCHDPSDDGEIIIGCRLRVKISDAQFSARDCTTPAAVSGCRGEDGPDASPSLEGEPEAAAGPSTTPVSLELQPATAKPRHNAR